MAKTDKAAFLGELRAAEKEMDRVFGQLARDIGQVVLRNAGPDGTVPVERLPEVQRQARQLVDRVFVGPSGQAFDDRQQPQADYPRIIAEGQLAMIDQALARQAAILDRVLPEDVRQAMVARYQAGGRG